MATSNNNIYAIVDNDETPVMRIPLTDDLQKEITSLFETQKQDFIKDKNEIKFTGSYNVDQGEIFAITNFAIPESIITAVQNPLGCPILELKDEKIKIKAIFSGKWQNGEKIICFQVFDRSKTLSRGLTLINSNKTYKKLEDPGLTLSDKLTAVYKNQKLLFLSYHLTKRFLDLSDYYEEATDEDLDRFSESSLFEFEKKESFKENADSIIRKKIALILKNGILENLTIDIIQRAVDDLNQHMSENNRIDVIINNGKLLIPADKKKLKELIRFLDEDYFTAPLTHQKCITNSKLYIGDK